MSGWGWDTPPGTPSGTTTTELTLVCPGCGETISLAQVYERDTGAYYIEPEECPECNHEITPEDLAESEPG